MSKLAVTRYGFWDPVMKAHSGDRLSVGDIDLGEFRDISDAEYRRAAAANAGNPAFHMRPMFFTGSPFGAEILELARAVRPNGELMVGAE
jgi:hypothetical protein